jgi:hypothetical protein
MITTRQPRSARRAPDSIKLHIEELVLDSFSTIDRRRIAEGVQQKLARLVSESLALQALRQSLTVDQVAGGTFRVDARSNPKAMASQIAHAIYEGVQRGIGAPNDFPAIRPYVPAGDRQE